MKETTLFAFTGVDAAARLYVCVVGGALVFVSTDIGGLDVLLAAIPIVFLVVIGLRSSVRVTSCRANVTKKWFFVPYWHCAAPVIDDVDFDGDWGLEELSSCVVVKLKGKWIPIGSRKTMRNLYDALLPLRGFR